MTDEIRTLLEDVMWYLDCERTPKEDSEMSFRIAKVLGETRTCNRCDTETGVYCHVCMSCGICECCPCGRDGCEVCEAGEE